MNISFSILNAQNAKKTVFNKTSASWFYDKENNVKARLFSVVILPFQNQTEIVIEIIPTKNLKELKYWASDKAYLSLQHDKIRLPLKGVIKKTKEEPVNKLHPIKNGFVSGGWKEVKKDKSYKYHLVFSGVIPSGISEIALIDPHKNNSKLKNKSYEFRNVYINNPYEWAGIALNNETSIKNAINNSKDDPYIGIYESINNNYKIAILKQSSTQYVALNLSVPTISSKWNIGDIKGYLRSSVDLGILKADWELEDKSSISDATLYFDESKLKLNYGNKYENYVKMFPLDNKRKEKLADNGLNENNSSSNNNTINTFSQNVKNTVQSSIEKNIYYSNIDTSIPINTKLSNNNTFAVIIANENYNSVSNVPYAKRDGQILEKYLTQSVGLPKDHVKIYEDASFGNIAAALKHIENLSEAFGSDLNIIFYYSGHGMPNEKTKNPMLIPIDGDATIPETCYDLEKLITNIGSFKAKSVIVLLDACFSGTERGDGMLMAARGIRIRSNNTEPIGNMIILSASQGDETAYPLENEKHGLFTYYILKKLQENKGDVTLGELSDYVIDKVKRQSVVSNGKIQTPSISVSPEIFNSWREIKFGGN